MKRTRFVSAALICSAMLAFSANAGELAERGSGGEQLQLGEQVQVHEQDQLRERDMYGWQLMTPEEQAEHRSRMRSFATEEEREAYRVQHHQKMQERARELGVTLPETPAPSYGGGTDPAMRGKGFGGGGQGGRGPGGGRR